MDIRYEKGKQIVAEGKVRPGPGGYLVTASDSAGAATYRVTLEGLFPTCTCDDWELRGGHCKHIFATRIYRAQEVSGPKPCDEPTPLPAKKTYKQVWPAYNAAQTNEKDHFQDLLAD